MDIALSPTCRLGSRRLFRLFFAERFATRSAALAAALLVFGSTAHAATYYWDNNSTVTGFGTAGGTWSSAGSTLWSGNSTGGTDATLGTTVTTTTSDALNFGTSTNGLAAGTITVSGGVSSAGITFGNASGNITLSGGNITLNGTITASGAVAANTVHTIGSNITLNANTSIGSGLANERYILSGVISGSGTSLNLTAPNTTGSVTLTGNNTFDGNLIVTTGQGAINSIANSGQASAAGAGSTIIFGATGGQTPILWYTGSVSASSNRTIQLGTSSGYSGTTTIISQNASLTLSGDVSSDSTSGATLVLSGDAGGGSNFNEISGRISGNLTVTGTNSTPIGGTGEAGKWILSGNNTYSRQTNVQGSSILRIAHNNALGSTANGTLVATGSALELIGGISVGAEALSLSGTGISNGGGLRNITGDNSYAGAITLGAASRINSDAGNLTLTGGITGAQNLTFGGAGNTTVSTAAISTGAGTFTKDGAGTLTLSSSGNTWSGQTTISAGALTLSGNLNTSGIVKIGGAAGAVLNITGNLTKTGGGSDPRTFQIAQSSGHTGTVNVSGSGILTFGGGMMFGDNGGGNGTMNVSGGTVTSSSSVWFAGPNSALNVSGGTFNAGTQTIRLGGGSGTTISTLSVNGSGTFNAGTMDFGIGGAGATTIINLGDGTAGGNFSITNMGYSGGATHTINFNGGTFTANGSFSMISQATTVVKSGGAIINVVPTTTFTIGTDLTDGGGGGGLTKNNTGTLILSGTNTYTGATTINAGTLTLSGTNTYTSAITINAGQLEIAATGRLGAGTYAGAITNNGTLIYSGTNDQTLSGAISGTGALTVNTSTSRTLTLSNAANTYNGATTVSAGTLAVSGNISSSALTVNSGAVISAGSSTGAAKFNAASITINGGSGYNWTLLNGGLGTSAGTDYDQMSTAGALTFNNTAANPFTVYVYGDANDWDGSLNNSWNIMSAGSLSGFNSANFSVNLSNFGVASANRPGIWSFASSGGNITLSYTLATPDYFWNGTTGNWNDAYVPNTTGFTPGPPETDKNIFFSGSGGTVTNNIASGNLSSLAGITFNSTAGAYTLAANAGSAGASGGTAMTVKGDITNNSTSTQTINLDIALGGSSTGTVDTAAGNIAMGGKISGSGALVKSGASTLTLSGNNTYTGGTTINAGTIQLNHANGLGTSGSITFGGGGLTYGNQTTDIASRIKNSGSAILIDTNNNNVTYSGVIDSTNVGGLTKAGSGTLTLNASNTYTGATTINAGTLEIGVAGRLGAGTYSGAITNNGVLIYSGTNDQTLSGVIGGSGAITKNGTSTLTINNTASTHSGSLTVNSGNLSASGTISSSVALNTGARISVSSNTTAAQFSAGSLTIGAGSGYTFTIARVSTSTPGTDYDQIALSGGLTLNNTAGSPFTVYVSGAGTGWSNTGIYHWDIITAASLSGAFAAGNFTTDFTGFSVAAGSRNGTWSFSNPSAGTIRLSYFGTMPGNSTWNTTSANWNATASWVEGVIPVNNNNLTFNGTVGTPVATNNIANGTLNTVNNITFAAGAAPYTLNANSGSAGFNTSTALTVTGAITNNSSNLQTMNMSLSITNSPVINTASGNITIGGVIAGNGGITKEGTSTLTLSGANTYNGTTNINAGTLALGANQNLKAIAGAGALNLSTFNLSTNASSNTTFSGVISGTGNFTKDGNGMLTLSGNNTYSGATIINAGSSLIGGLTVSHANALGTTANGTTVASGAALQLSGGISIGAEALSLNGTGNNNGGALRNISGNNSYAGTITLAANSRINSDANTLTLSGDITGNTRNLTIGGAGNTTVSGNITTTTGTLTKDGAGTLTLSGNNTYSGDTTISLGTLQVGGAGRLGGGSYSGNISNSGTLIYSGTNNQTLSGVISGIGALTKNAASTLTLSGNNDYSGTTTISAGALRATHANALGSTAAGTTVASGAALELSGGISIGAEALSLAGTGISTGGALRNISGNNSYAGTITLAANSRINSDANTLTLSGDITGNARNLTIGGAGHTTVSGNITTTTGTLTKDGAGTLTLSGVNTYSGATTINSGTLVVNGSAANSAVTIGNTGVLGGNGTVGALTVQSGGRVAPGNSPGNLNASTLTLEGGGGYNWEITNVSGNASTDWDLITVGGGTGAATISATSGNKFTIYISGNPVGWDTNAPFDWNIIDWGTVTGFDANAFAVDTTGFTGTAPVGTWTFSNTAGYLNLAYTVATDPIWSGASGNWTTGFSPALTTGNKSITFAGAAGGTATNDIASGTVGSVASITFNSTAGAYTLAANTGSAGYDTASALQLLGNIVNNSTATQTINLALTSTATRVYDAAAGNLTIGGVISGTGGLTKNGSNLLTLSANNTYSGDTTINAGTVQITTTGLLGGGNYSGNIANNGALLLGSNSNQTLGGVISGTGALTKNGTGTLTLVGNNNYSGNTTLNTGTVVIGHANAAGTGRIVQTNGSSVLKIDTAGTISNDMSVYNVLATQSATLSGAITVNNATWDIDTGDTLTISGAVSGTGGVTKIGNGTLILSGSNSYNGSTVINAGTLNAANANALGSNNTVQVNGGTLLVSTDDAINGKNIVMAGSGVGLQFSGTYSGAIGNLTLSADSIIDLGTGSVQILFQGLTLSNHTLSFYNWNGTTLWNGGTGADTDRVYFGPDLSDAALAKIYFYSGPGDSFLGSGFDLGLEATGFTPAWGHQIIPVPEPETWATGILLVLGGGVWLWRKRRNFTTQPDLEGAAPSAPQEGRASAPIDKMVGLFRRNDPHQRQSRPHALPAKSVMI